MDVNSTVSWKFIANIFCKTICEKIWLFCEWAFLVKHQHIKVWYMNEADLVNSHYGILSYHLYTWIICDAANKKQMLEFNAWEKIVPWMKKKIVSLAMPIIVIKAWKSHCSIYDRYSVTLIMEKVWRMIDCFWV